MDDGLGGAGMRVYGMLTTSGVGWAAPTSTTARPLSLSMLLCRPGSREQLSSMDLMTSYAPSDARSGTTLPYYLYLFLYDLNK